MDQLLTVHDYYDGPRLGIAQWNGVPHIYEAEYDHSTEEYGDTYFLSPIEPELLALVLEDWNIWLRWEAARKRNEVPADPHGVMPNDAKRSVAVKTSIGDRLRSDPKNRVNLRAAFNDRMTGVVWHQVQAQRPLCDAEIALSKVSNGLACDRCWPQAAIKGANL